MNRQRKLLILVLAGLLLIAAAWSYSLLHDKRESALAAKRNLEQCQQIASKIASLQTQPKLAADYERLSGETTSLIEQAAKAAGIEADKISRITPASPQRIEKTTYKEKSTQVLLKEITIQQLVEMAYRLLNNNSPLTPKSIRLIAPKADDTGDIWNVELVISYLIYEPQKIE